MPDYTFRLAREEDLPRMHHLWRTGFGDTEAFMACFEQRMFHSEWMELALCQDEPAAMLTLIPCTLHLASGGVYRSGFYYALTTAPEHRGQGLAPELLKKAVEHRVGKGMDCLLGVPDNDSLYLYYDKVARLKEAFYTRMVHPTAEELTDCRPLRLQPVDAGEYYAIRESYLGGTTYVSWDREAVDFQGEICRQGDGGLYRLEGSRPGCAAVQYTADGALLVNEVLADEEDLPGCLAGILERMPAERSEFRMPTWMGTALGGEIRHFGVITPGGPQSRITGKNGYIGLDLA